MLQEFPRQPAPDLDPSEKELTFQIIDWFTPESDKSKRIIQQQTREYNWDEPAESYTIYMYGATEEGYTVTARVVGFEPYFFVKPPESWWKNMKSKIADLKVTLLEGYVANPKTGAQRPIISKRLKDHLLYVKAVKRKDFWGFTNGADFPFIKIKVKSLALFNSLKYYFQGRAKDGFKLYESNIDPFLRFIHERDIRPCGWVTLHQDTYDVIEGDEDNHFSRSGFNVEVRYTDVHPNHNMNKIAPLLIASFDLECTSSHGDFPVARKTYRKLAMDLVEAAYALTVSEPLTEEILKGWIIGAFAKKPTDTEQGVTIHHVYPKSEAITQKHIDRILSRGDVMLEIYNQVVADVKERRTKRKETTTVLMGDDNDDDEDGPENDGENGLANILTSYLPPLQGDPIIQIGTTVNRYGSDEIIYKHIITLKSCDEEECEGIEVESYKTEEEVILAWKELMCRLNPDILTGYNIFGFDMDYIWERAKELGCEETLSEGLGRISARKTMLIEQKLSSSALGDNILRYFDMDGVVSIDMLKVMQRDHKLDSYKLDHVASVFLGDNKNDLKPKEIFEKFKGSAKDRAEIARYCIQDCALVNRLIHKLKVLENNIGMGNVCSVPLSYLFMRGQGVKIFSLVAKECRETQHLIPVLRNFNEESLDEDQSGYEGAIVLEPMEGIYLDDPITVLDYSSLYPSSMIERNLSHDCYVVDDRYAHLEDQGISYITVTYDVFEGVGDKKKCVDKKHCTFAQLPNNQKGIIPNILMKLLQQRKNTRKKIEYERVYLSDGRVGIGLTKELPETQQLEILNVDQANLGEGFGGHKALVSLSDVVKREQAFNSFEQAVLDALQLAYKITANSLYGQIGARTSPIYWKDIAASTTATGRERIMMAKSFAEKEFQGEVIYGDSVSGDTPLILRYPDGLIDIKTIETLNDEWSEYPGFKPWDKDRHDKEQTTYEAEVWSDGCWAKIRRVIRHKVKKKIYRVNTFKGCVDVTEDHSIIGLNGDPIKPTECVVGSTKIRHTFPDEFPESDPMLPKYIKMGNTPKEDQEETITCSKCKMVLRPCDFNYYKTGKVRKPCKLCCKKRICERLNLPFDGQVHTKILTYDVSPRTVTVEEAWVMGMFFGDGSCGHYTDCPSGSKASWAINNQNLDFLNQAKKYLEQVEPREVVKEFKILDTMKSSNVYKLVPTGSMLYMVRKYRELFYDKDDYKKVPKIILNAPEEIMWSFLEGYLTADGGKAEMHVGNVDFACKGKIGAMGLYYICKSLGYSMLRINIREEKENTYWIRGCKDRTYFENNENNVMKVLDLGYAPDGSYVYDLETSMGKFHGGVGETLLFNTDSVFIRFSNLKENGTKAIGKEALALSIKTGMEMARRIKSILPAPQSLEYEKTFYPWILLSKKRYVGNLYEDDPHKKPKQKSMGIVLKRRDNAPIVKKLYGGIIDTILNQHDLAASVEFLKSELQKMVDGNVPLEDLIITKTLRAQYKDPKKIAHKVLADRMGARDPGNKPAANDRIPFVYVRPPPEVEVKLQGDRLEHPDYIREHNLKPDYRFYITNQLMKPICQLYALCVEQLPGYGYPPSYWVQIDVELEEKDLYKNPKKRKDRISALKMKVVEELLFEPYLVQLGEDIMKKAKAKTAAPRKKPVALCIGADAIATDAPILQLIVNDNKKNKCYDTEMTLIHQDEVIFEEKSQVEKKRSVTTKQSVYQLTAENAMQRLYKEKRGSQGVRIQVGDKIFLRNWKKALTMAEDIKQQMAEAIQNQDIGALNETKEQFTFMNLVDVSDKIPYSLESLPSEASTPSKDV